MNGATVTQIVDYRRILVAYIRHVGDAEGVTFLGRSVEHSRALKALSEDERVALLLAGLEAER